MNHPWQQPIRPLEYAIRKEVVVPDDSGEYDYRPAWSAVLFVRPREGGWEIMGFWGTRWTDETAMLREVAR